MRPVYGQHLKQILITIGGLIVAEQLIHVVWGAVADPACRCRERCAASYVLGDVAIEKLPRLSPSRSDSSCSAACSWCSTARGSAC